MMTVRRIFGEGGGLIWSGLSCVWGAGLLVHELPFLHWSHAAVAAVILQWLAYLPVAALVVAGFRALLLVAPEAASESKNVAYIARLDHLRFFAAALVVMYHLYRGMVSHDARSENLIFNLVGEGSSGVDLFFVLSGFIFGLIGHGKKIHYGNFIFSRLVRIFPLYLLGILIVVATSAGQFTPLDITLLLFPVVDVGMMPGLPGFGQLWTIGLEFQFYLIFPFLIAFTAKLGPRYLIGLIVLGLMLRGFYFFDRGSVRNLTQWSMIGRFDQFALGMLAAVIYFRRSRLFASPLHLVVSIALMFGCFRWLEVWGGFHRGEDSVIWVFWNTVEGLMWSYLLLSYLACRIAFPRWWDEGFSKLGQLSFSIYVFHSYAMYWVLKRFSGYAITGTRETDAVLLGLFVCVPAAVVIALPSYHLIEKQFFVFRRKYVEPLPVSAAQ